MVVAAAAVDAAVADYFAVAAADVAAAAVSYTHLDVYKRQSIR